MTMRTLLVTAGLVVAVQVGFGLGVGFGPTASVAHADRGVGGVAGLGGFRCGTGRIVRNGETQGQIARKCGDPDSTRTWSETRTESVWVAGRRVERQVIITYDEWEYDEGPHKLVRFLTFLEGKLIRVTTGDYGS